ncbi:MAG: M48 family metalloprotease [Gammaproteobacteria bacterium]
MSTVRFFTITIFLALLALGVASPAIELPDFGDSAGGAVSPEQERSLGQQLVRHLRHQSALIDDPELEAYIQALGLRLAATSDNPAQSFTFFLVNDPSINAFAAPGGFIGTHAGLILNAETESELAGVLAHEIAHVTQRHMARTFEKASQLSIPMAAAMLGAILIGTQNPEAGQAALAAVSAGSAQYQLDFTRSNEEEADRVGIETLIRAGFDPEGMPAFFERLHRSNRLAENAQLPEFLRTHPVTVSRIADARNRLARLPRKPHADSLDFHLARARLQLAGAHSRRDAVAYFRDRRDGADATRAAAARYGYALALTDLRDYTQARKEIDILLRKDAENPAYLLAAAQIALAAERNAEALELYARTARLYPNFRPVVLAYTRARLRAGDAAGARQLLRDYALNHEPDIAYYGLLAEAEGKAGSQTEAQIAIAEQRYLLGETELARNQFRFIQRSAGIDHYQRQRVEARLKEVEQTLKEEEESGDNRLPIGTRLRFQVKPPAN